MSGESNFYIFTRCKSSGFDESTTVCCISKELKSARKFISFAVLEKDENDNFLIKNLKKQEIPHQTHHIEDLDLSEISFTFLDNGDNRIFVYLKEELQNSNMQLMGDFYEPINTMSNMMLACSGDLVSLKELEIRLSKSEIELSIKYAYCESINASSCCFDCAISSVFMNSTNVFGLFLQKLLIIVLFAPEIGTRNLTLM